MYVATKGQALKLSPNWTSKEFDCSCTNADCEKTFVSKELVDILQKVREEFGSPLQVTSGFRCLKKQQELAAQGFETAKGISTHELGCAVDIRPFKMTPEEHLRLYFILEKYFKSIGIAKSFYHCDLRLDAERRRWFYAGVDKSAYGEK